MPDTNKKDGDEKEGGSKISNTEWGMAIGALFLIDAIEIGIDFAFGIGAFTNPFIDFLVGMAWPTYLHFRGVNIKSVKIVGSFFLTFIFQIIPFIDGLWGIEGLYVFFVVKAEEKIKEETGVDVEKVAAAGEGGETATGEEAGESGPDGKTGGEEDEPKGEAGGAEEGGGVSDEDADAMGQESDASDQERESDNPESTAEEGDEGDQDHEVSDEDADELGKQSDSQSEGGEDGEDEKKKKDGKKKKQQGQRGGGDGIWGGGSRGGSEEDADSSGPQRGRGGDEKAEGEADQRRSNLLDLSLSYGARKKQKEKGEDETSLSE